MEVLLGKSSINGSFSMAMLNNLTGNRCCDSPDDPRGVFFAGDGDVFLLVSCRIHHLNIYGMTPYCCIIMVWDDRNIVSYMDFTISFR